MRKTERGTSEREAQSAAAPCGKHASTCRRVLEYFPQSTLPRSARKRSAKGMEGSGTQATATGNAARPDEGKTHRWQKLPAPLSVRQRKKTCIKHNKTNIYLEKRRKKLILRKFSATNLPTGSSGSTKKLHV